MTVFLAAEIPACCLVTIYVIHRMLRTHHEIMAAVIGRRARAVVDAVGGAEERITDAARTGLRTRYGPARLRDQDATNSGTRVIPGGSA